MIFPIICVISMIGGLIAINFGHLNSGIAFLLIGCVLGFSFLGLNAKHPHIGQYPIRKTLTMVQQVPKSHIILTKHHSSHIHYRRSLLKGQSKKIIFNKRVYHHWVNNGLSNAINIFGSSQKTTLVSSTYYVPKNVKIANRLN